ncbi:hypothetical protein CYMTET_32268, partial [Cymbomonas tetramitiformis]
ERIAKLMQVEDEDGTEGLNILPQAAKKVKKKKKTAAKESNAAKPQALSAGSAAEPQIKKPSDTISQKHEQTVLDGVPDGGILEEEKDPLSLRDMSGGPADTKKMHPKPEAENNVQAAEAEARNPCRRGAAEEDGEIEHSVVLEVLVDASLKIFILPGRL